MTIRVVTLSPEMGYMTCQVTGSTVRIFIRVVQEYSAKVVTESCN